jgi:hypothetical protein
MNREPLRVGDELIEPGRFAHKMEYVGPIGPFGEDVLDPAKGKPARFVHWNSIPDKDQLRIGQRGPESWHEQSMVQARARQVVARGTVNRTFGPNCEHICSYVRAGKSESPLLQIGFGLGALGLALFFLSRD